MSEDQPIDVDMITNAQIDDLMCVAMRNGKGKIVEICRVAINLDLDGTPVQDAARAMCAKLLTKMRDEAVAHAARRVLASDIPSEAPGGLSARAREELSVLSYVDRTSNQHLPRGMKRTEDRWICDGEHAAPECFSPQCYHCATPAPSRLACEIVENGGPYQVYNGCVHISDKELAELKNTKHGDLIKAACDWAIAEGNLNELYAIAKHKPDVDLLAGLSGVLSERVKALCDVARRTARELGWIP